MILDFQINVMSRCMRDQLKTPNIEKEEKSMK